MKKLAIILLICLLISFMCSCTVANNEKENLNNDISSTAKVVSTVKEDEISKFKIAYIRPEFSENTELYEINGNTLVVTKGEASYFGDDEKILEDNFLENPKYVDTFTLSEKDKKRLVKSIVEICNDDEENRPFANDANSVLIGVNNIYIRYYSGGDGPPYTTIFNILDKYYKRYV